MPSRDATIDALDAAAAASQAAVRRAVIDAITALRQGITDAEVRAALESRSAVPIFESAAWIAFAKLLSSIFASDGPLRRTMDRAITRTLLSTPVVDPAAFSFEPVYERAILWLEREGARFVTNVTLGTKAAIRRITQESFAEPVGIREAARRLLKLKGFGLTVPQTRTLRLYTTALMTGEIEGSAGLTSKQIDRLVQKRFNLMRKQRARLASHTEPANAGLAAQRELWDEAVLQQQLDVDLYVLQWVTRVIRVCPRCIALNGKLAEIHGGLFTSRPIAGGGKWNGIRIVIARPTVHPDCHCALRVVRRPEASEVNRPRALGRRRILSVGQARGSWPSRPRHREDAILW